MLYANVDWAVSEVAGEAKIAGWAFNGQTDGQHPFSVKVRYSASGGGLVEAKVLRRYSGLHRPDVAAAFAGTIPALNKFTGYELHVQLPSGQQNLNIEWADSQGAVYVTATVVVK